MLSLFLSFIFFSGLLFFPFSLQAKDPPLRYDLSCAGSGTPGISLVKVSVYVNKSTITTSLLKKAVVHGVIFKGYNDAQWGRKRPLASSAVAEQEHSDFFVSFFHENGAYMKYADMVEGSMQTVRSGKKEYKITATLMVAETELKQALEEAGVIKKLTNGF